MWESRLEGGAVLGRSGIVVGEGCGCASYIYLSLWILWWMRWGMGDSWRGDGDVSGVGFFGWT